MVPSRAPRICVFSLPILCKASLSVVIASRRCSIQAFCLCRLSFSTQSVRFVLPSAFFFHKYVFLIVIFSINLCLANLYLSPGEAFPKRRSWSLYSKMCINKNKGYTVIHNSVIVELCLIASASAVQSAVPSSVSDKFNSDCWSVFDCFRQCSTVIIPWQILLCHC